MFGQLFNNYRKFDLFKFFLFAAVVAIIPYLNLSGASAMVLGGVALTIAITSSVEFCALCVVYTIPFALGVQGVFGGINLNNALQFLFILKALKKSDNIVPINKAIGICLAAFVTQLFPMLVCNQTISNIVILIINVLLYYIFYRMVRGGRMPYILTFIAFSIGVLISCAVAQYGSFQIKNSDYIGYDFFRFCALWTDPNFLGAFCNIALATCLYLSQGKTKNLLLLLPIMLLSIYFGFKTLSFTYIILLVTVLVSFMLSYVKNTGQLIFLVFISAIIIAPYIIGKIDDVMVSRIVGDETDFSHGRLTSSLNILSIWFSKIPDFLFGFGYNNTLEVLKHYSGWHLASHNSYVDLITEFGLLVNIVFFSYIIIKGYLSSKYIKPLISPMGIVAFVTLLAMGTVSGLKYEFIFIFFACYIAQVENDNSDIVDS